MKKLFLILVAAVALSSVAVAEFDDDILISVGEFSLYFGWGLTYTPETLDENETIFPLLQFVESNYDALEKTKRRIYAEISNIKSDEKRPYTLFVSDSDGADEDERCKTYHLKTEAESVGVLLSLLSESVPNAKRAEKETVTLYIVVEKHCQEITPPDWIGEFLRHLPTYKDTKDGYLYAIYFSSEKATEKALQNPRSALKKAVCTKKTVNRFCISQDTELEKLLGNFETVKY